MGKYFSYSCVHNFPLQRTKLSEFKNNALIELSSDEKTVIHSKKNETCTLILVYF